MSLRSDRAGAAGSALAVAFVAAAVITAPPSAQAETPLERGTYLMQSLVACGNCHTPKGPQGDIPGMELAGMAPIDVREQYTANAPNITQDKETGIGAWSDEEIIAAIREGKRPDGSIIGPPMPIGLYSRMSDSDVKAIVAYLRTVKPVKNAVPKSEYKIPLPPSYGPPVANVADVPKDDKVAYGAYLAGPIAHCIECHSPMSDRGPDIEHRLGAGGLDFNGPWGVSHSANITPTGIADKADAEVKVMIRRGVRPDGSHMMPPMPYPYYARMSDEDLDAIVTYLRSLPPK